MIGARTVNLVHIADECCAVRGDPASTCRRFFPACRPAARLGRADDCAARAGRVKPRLVVDRTNWKVGATYINRLVLAIRTRHSQVPLLRTVLEKAGSSDRPERLERVERSIAAIGQDSIAMLLADRESIGCDGFNYLGNKNIPLTKSVRAARTTLGNAAPPRKTHGNLAKPYFKTGFTFIRSRLRSDEPDVIIAWVRLKLSVQKARVVSTALRFGSAR